MKPTGKMNLTLPACSQLTENDKLQTTLDTETAEICVAFTDVLYVQLLCRVETDFQLC